MDGNTNEALVDKLAETERAKYEKAWAIPDYSRFSPGKEHVPHFIDIAHPWPWARIIDFGCGDGTAAMLLADLRYTVTGIDHVDVRKRNGRKKYKFHQHTLWMPFEGEELGSLKAEYGYCCDVLEHIPEDKIDAVLTNIFGRCRQAYLSISFTEDHFGKTIDETLHVTVKPYEWWVEKIEKFAKVKIGRDLMHSGVFFAQSGGKEGLTITALEAEENLRNSLSLNLPQLHGFDEQDRQVVMLAGGPSLNDHIEEIQQKRKDGALLVTVNGAHDWALDHDMIPSIMFVADGREHNERFVRRPQKDCLYYLSSTCHPKVFENLGHFAEPPYDAPEGYKVVLWHSVPYPEITVPIMKKHYLGLNFCLPTGGSTVSIRALNILELLGYRNISAYGLDGCYGSEHAYDQPENAGEEVFPVKVGGREFMCSGWQYGQALHFLDNVKHGGLNKINLEVHGDGLIAWIIKIGAESHGSLNESLPLVQSAYGECADRP